MRPVLLSTLPSLALVGCALFGGSKADDTASPYLLVLEDAHNYRFEQAFETTPVAVQDCPEDLTIDWSGVTTDLVGRTVDPSADIDKIILAVLIDLDVDEVLQAIASESLSQSSFVGAVEYEPSGGETAAPLSEFSFNGVSIDVHTRICAVHEQTFLLGATTGLYEYRMFAFIEPMPDEPNTTVALDSSLTTMDLTVDLERGGVISVPSHQPMVVDWSALTTDGRGNSLSLTNLDRLEIAHFALTIPELEANFVDLESQALELYTTQTVYDSNSLDLSLAIDASGTPFAGFTDEGLWLLGLFCTTCASAPPHFLAVIQAE